MFVSGFRAVERNILGFDDALVGFEPFAEFFRNGVVEIIDRERLTTDGFAGVELGSSRLCLP